MDFQFKLEIPCTTAGGTQAFLILQQLPGHVCGSGQGREWGHATQRYFSLAVWYSTHEPAHSSTGPLSWVFKMKFENEIEKVSPHSLWSHPEDTVDVFLPVPLISTKKRSLFLL